MEPKKDIIESIINAYNNGQSMNSIAKKFHTYPTTISRLLIKHHVKLRHDTKKGGEIYTPNGEKLLEWAKNQDRLVTKTELAEQLGKKRLPPSYFLKFPELGKYITTYGYSELQEYTEKLYEWLRKNEIPYKPNDRTTLRMSLTALLLGEYAGLALEINIKPSCVSKKQFEKTIEEKKNRATKKNLRIIFLQENHFANMDKIMDLLKPYVKE